MMSSTHKNTFLLAADNSPELLPILRANPSLASAQDDHGYSLVHAAASYNHLDLLRTLVLELHVPVNLRDEDGETALFVCETVECAKILVEELHSDPRVKGDECKTAGEKIREEGDFPEVATYLLELDGVNGVADGADGAPNGNGLDSTVSEADILNRPPKLPEGVIVEMGTMTPEDIGEEVIDPEFKRRIEELAARGDFQGEEGQRELRELITEAVRGQVGQDRHVRRRAS